MWTRKTKWESKWKVKWATDVRKAEEAVDKIVDDSSLEIERNR